MRINDILNELTARIGRFFIFAICEHYLPIP